MLFALTLGPGYARQLVKRLKDRTGGRLTLLDGSAYPALRDLETAGHVACDESSEGDGKPRRVYSLTRSGQREAQQVEKTLKSLLGWDDSN